MSTYNSFEDLPVWIKASDLAVFAYRVIARNKIKHDYGLKDQIQRAVISISSNIAEGFERGSRQGFVQFLCIAKGSCGELRSQVSIANRIGLIDEKDCHELVDHALTVSRQISGFIDYLKKSKVSGRKFL